MIKLLLEKTLAFQILYLSCLWPFIHVANENFDKLTSGYLDKLLIYPHILFACTLWLVLMYRAVFRVSIAPVVLFMAAFITMFFLNWSLEKLMPFGAYALFSGVVIFILTGLGRYKSAVSVIAVMAWAFLIYPSIEVSQKIIHTLDGQKQVGSVQVVDAQTPKITPNVYYIMADGFPRQDVSGYFWKIDYQPMFDRLYEEGYRILKQAHSNYPVTHLSIASTLAMDYLSTEDEKSFAPNYYPLFSEIAGGNNATVKQFKKFGYRSIHMGAQVYTITECGGAEDLCLNYGRGSFLKELDVVLLKMTPLRHIEEDVIIKLGGARVTTLPLFEQRLEERKAEIKPPYFAFIHTIPPHAPYMYTPDCRVRSLKGMTDAIETTMESDYKDGVSCVLKQFVTMAEYIEKTDPNAIVIFQSDHGSHFNVDFYQDPKIWSNKALFERYSVFSAIKAPKQCQNELRQDLSNVNTMRFVLACIAGHSPHYLKDRYFGTSYVPNTPGYGRIVEFKEIPATLTVNQGKSDD